MKYLIVLFIFFPFLTHAKTAQTSEIINEIVQTQKDLKSHAISPEMATREFRKELADLRKSLDEIFPDPTAMTDEEVLKNAKEFKILTASGQVEIFLPLRSAPGLRTLNRANETTQFMRFAVPASEAARHLKTPGSYAVPITGKSGQ